MSKNFTQEWKNTLDFIMKSYSEHLFLLPEEINKDNFAEYGIPVTCSYIKRMCEKAYNESIVLDELSERQIVWLGYIVLFQVLHSHLCQNIL